MSQIHWFETLGTEDLEKVGGKNANLGEMVKNLKARGIRVPNGFAVSSAAYWTFVDHNQLRDTVYSLLHDLDHDDLAELRIRAQKIRDAYLKAKFPDSLRAEILTAYRKLVSLRNGRTDVAVRSSATAEDLPNASFAGQQETYLNVQGEDHLIESIQRCFSSLFTDRAIGYRKHAGYDHFKVALSVGVQEMVRSDLGVSGVMFTLDTESGFRDAVIMNASYGLGENVVQGNVNPDEYIVFKPTLIQGKKPILKKKLGSKESRMVYAPSGEGVQNIPTPLGDRFRFSLTDEQILELARFACIIEDHYSQKHDKSTPMDIEWAMDGLTGELFIVQARPETVQSQKSKTHSLRYKLLEKSEVLVTGRSVGEKIASGRVRVIESPNQIHELVRGEILVTDRTDPDWEPAMKIASAIVTNRGGRTCHAAIIARELGIPAVVGTETGTYVLKTGMDITVSSAEGETGFIYDGLLPFETIEGASETTDGLKTAIMLNLGNPEEAFKLSTSLPTKGVGLARLEFIIGNGIKIHPMALIRYPNLADDHAKREIEKLTHGYEDKSEYFVDKLAQETATIAAAFYPNDVIVRMSDFKSNEYANLIGGREFEPQEENPMIGVRGASRYFHPRYQEGFALECKAMKIVREEMGLTNLKLMIPFCRTLKEAEKVRVELKKNGLVRGEHGLELYMMVEIPSNVMLIDEFGEYFDGFSIGSNDLTQLTLGIDRDSELIAESFDERDPAVKKMISHAIRSAIKNGKKIGICGQGPSDYPEFAAFLVEEGIHSISLNPDSIIKTIPTIRKMELERSKK
jgi:pyruvate,water dikinase